MTERDYVNIVFDGPPSHDAPRFIEVETLEGASIRLGEWVRMPEDRAPEWALRIPISEPAWEHELSIAVGSAENMRLDRDRAQAENDHLVRKLEAVSKLASEDMYIRLDPEHGTSYWEGYSYMQDLVQQVIESPEEDA